MTWEMYFIVRLFELVLLLFFASSVFFWTRTVEWFMSVNSGKPWIVIYLGGVILIPISPILYFTHARKYLKEQKKVVDKK